MSASLNLELGDGRWQSRTTLNERNVMPTVPDVWTDEHQERQALLELLETLTPQQWDTPSLCAQFDGVFATSSDT